MGWLLEHVVDFGRNTWTVIRLGWTQLDERSRWVVAIATGVELFALVFTSSLLYSGAVFAVAMTISLGLLCYSIPPILRFLSGHYLLIDLFMVVSTLFIGFFLGPTMAVSLMFFGLCLSAGLRICRAVSPEYGKSWSWDNVFGGLFKKKPLKSLPAPKPIPSQA